ncbi:phage tail tape measure protein [Fusobacterium necrophorum subsp. funduliforme]
MSAKAEEITIKLKALLDKNFGGNFKQFSEKIHKLSDGTSKLASQNEKLAKFKKNFEGMAKSGKKISALGKDLHSARERLQKMEQQMQKATKVTKAMEIEHRKASQAVQKLEDKIAHQKSAFEKYRIELKKLRLPLREYRKELDNVRKAEARLSLKEQISGKVNKIKSSIAGIGKKVLNAGKVATVAGVALATAGAYSSANSYLDFNKQMLKVKAISGATQEEYKKLESEAIRLGATTSFTAGEAAAGMEKFALAGFQTNDIIKVMPGLLDLAAASGEDLVMISDLISDHLGSFNLKVDDTGKFADVLANTMSRSNTNVEMLGEALKYAAAGAKDLHIPLETMTATVGLMGDQAIKAGMAGTNLKQAFSKLADSSVQKKLAAMGLQVKNSKGEFVGFVNFMEQLEKKTSKMNDTDKLGFLNNIFGDRGSMAINKILTSQKEFNGQVLTGVAALKAFSEENKNSAGKAKQMADVMLQGASGAMVLLSSAWESVKLGIGGAIFQESSIEGLKVVTHYLAEISNVIRGEFSTDPVNKKLQDILKTILRYKDKLLDAIQPVKEGLRTLFPDGIGSDFLSILKSTADFIIFLASAGANAFKMLAPLIKIVIDLINFIGVDKIALFIATFMGINRVLSLKNKLFDFIGVVRSIGGIIPLIQTALSALGGPIVWIIALIAVLGYALYKNWDTVKEWGKVIWNTAIEVASAIWEFAQKYWFLLGPIGLLIKLGTLLIKNWESIKTAIFSVWEVLKSAVSGIVNSISQVIFQAWEKLTGFFSKIKEKILDLPFVQKFIAKIEGRKEENEKLGIDGSHANGLNYVPYDGYVAELHEGERVLTADENKNLLGRFKKQEAIFQSFSRVSDSSVSTKTSTITLEQHFHFAQNTNKETMEHTAYQFKEIVKQALKELGIDEERVRY